MHLIRAQPAIWRSTRFYLVANKFQTGIDQPLPCGMYVDNRLAGIQAAQTLSRLNRSYSDALNLWRLKHRRRATARLARPLPNTNWRDGSASICSELSDSEVRGWLGQFGSDVGNERTTSESSSRLSGYRCTTCTRAYREGKGDRGRSSPGGECSQILRQRRS